MLDLIYKYLNNEASEDEVASIFEWIEDSKENKDQFIALKKTWAISATDESAKRSAWKNIEIELSKVKQKKRSKLWKYAAVIVVLIGFGKTISLIYNPNKITNNDKVVLESSNGNINYINEEQEKNLLDIKGDIIAEQHNNEIVYKASSTKRVTEIHTLKIPLGKTFKVTLSDGSIVHLNSGTTLKYPEQFGNETKRNVYLTGEAYFEVTKDEKRPFVVHSNNVAVEVLGTKFNITAYPEDENMHTVLVEGLVSISEKSTKSSNTLLAPNYKATWNEKTKSFDIENVDAGAYTAWLYGELVFKDATFSAISKKLERSYNVKIINNNDSLANQKFTGTIKVKESSIDNILDILKLDTPLKYSKHKNTIKITNSN
ncbi:MAG: FecR domain-containing protein [Psychroserpens sp.]|uniref:FecR family protein n=1 Tax=Psychroserpens sp. TaxID=2020870 RepID=UPI0030022EEB